MFLYGLQQVGRKPPFGRLGDETIVRLMHGSLQGDILILKLFSSNWGRSTAEEYPAHLTVPEGCFLELT